jgi:hypothetical protein
VVPPGRGTGAHGGTTKQTNFRAPSDLLDAIDKARGKLSRNAWLIAAAEAALTESRPTAPPRSSRPAASPRPNPARPNVARPIVSPRKHLPRCACAICKPPKKA